MQAEVTSAASRGAPSPLWPLTPGFPDPAIELVRSKLAAPTLAALRLVCRAARDDLVDGRCTRLRPARFYPRLESFLALAPRLRRLASLSAGQAAQFARASDLAACFSRLPGRGAALRELDLGNSLCRLWGSPLRAADIEQLGAALGGLAGLRVLKARVSESSAVMAPELAGVLALLRAGAGASPAARLDLDFGAWPTQRDQGAQLAAHLPLERIERLCLRGNSPGAVVPQLCEPGAAAALTALRSLVVHGGHKPELRHECLRQATPWLAQLTRLVYSDSAEDVGHFAGALAPGALAALQHLGLSASSAAWRLGCLPAAAVGAVLAACDPATLSSLSLCDVHFGDAARLVEGLPALSALRVLSGREARRGSPSEPLPDYKALASARLAPLTALEIDSSPWLFSRPARLAALLAAPWAASLRKLSLGVLRSWSGGEGWRALAAVSRLERLEDLQLQADVMEWSFERDSRSEHEHGGSSSGDDGSGWDREGGGWSGGEESDGDEDDGAAAAAAAAAVWAPRLVAFELCLDEYFDEDLRAVLALPFSARLERLTVHACLGAAPSWFMDECVRTLPGVKEIKVDAVEDV